MRKLHDEVLSKHPDKRVRHEQAQKKAQVAKKAATAARLGDKTKKKTANATAVGSVVKAFAGNRTHYRGLRGLPHRVETEENVNS